jgi:hypothetical protein
MVSGKRIGSVEDVIEEGERRFDLEVMGGASAAGRLLIELGEHFKTGAGKARRCPP